jgi:hypothetical protein
LLRLQWFFVLFLDGGLFPLEILPVIEVEPVDAVELVGRYNEASIDELLYYSLHEFLILGVDRSHDLVDVAGVSHKVDPPGQDLASLDEF